jgi:hypothetical protein
VSPLVIGLLIFVVTTAVLATGLPIAFGLGAVALAFMIAFEGFGTVHYVAETVFAGLNDFTLVSLPMFVIMGAAVASSRAGSDLYEALARWLHRVPGSLVISNLGACALFSALTGSSPATCAAIGKMGIPEMRRRGYDADLAAGAIAAGGTLGILIPPSITMILYGIASETSIGRLFIAGIIPGIMLTGLFMLWALFLSWKRGKRLVDHDRRYSLKEKLPYVKIVDGKLDLSEAYTNGVGAYDVAAIKYAYQNVSSDAALDALARATPLFVSDPHSRPAGGAHPMGSVWDNGTDPIAMLRHEIDVRRIALNDFGQRNLKPGEPLSKLEEILLPLYLHHRYQLESAAKSIGGVHFTYGATDPPRPVAVADQRRALAAVMATLDPEFLEIPKRIRDVIPPPSYAHGDANTEVFPRRTDPTFDPIAAAMTSADITVSALLDPARAARLAQREDNLTLREVLNALIDTASRQSAITRATRTLIMTRIAQLANNREADPQARAEAYDALRRLSSSLSAVSDVAENTHRRATRDEIERFLARPEAWQAPTIPTVPPGPPI